MSGDAGARSSDGFSQVIQETGGDSRGRETFAWGRRRKVSSFGKLKRKDSSRFKCTCGRWVRGEGVVCSEDAEFV